MHDYIFSRFLSTDTERGDDHPDILFGGKDSILPPKREEEKKSRELEINKKYTEAPSDVHL